MIKMKRKCHNCNGTGKVPTSKGLTKHPNITTVGKCYYCGGKGFRTSYYGKDR